MPPLYRFGPGPLHHDPGVLAWLFFALLVVLVGVGIAAVVRMWTRPGMFMGGPARHHFMHQPPPWADPAMAELRMRYARGDIDFDEFTRRATMLSQHGGFAPAEPPPPPPPS